MLGSINFLLMWKDSYINRGTDSGIVDLDFLKICSRGQGMF